MRDFAQVRINGFYVHYKPVIDLANLLILNMTLDMFDRDEDSGEVPVVLYALNMEKLFEMYIRSEVKKLLKRDFPGYELQPYNEMFPVLGMDRSGRGSYLPNKLTSRTEPSI